LTGRRALRAAPQVLGVLRTVVPRREVSVYPLPMVRLFTIVEP
jgi:hypothetical protein